MVEDSGGHRILIAPSSDIERYVTSTYSFDETRIESVDTVVEDCLWRVSSASLRLSFTVGGPLPLCRLLRLVPASVAAHPLWCRAVAPVATLIARGVRTV